jgi:hypothetical protein
MFSGRDMLVLEGLLGILLGDKKYTLNNKTMQYTHKYKIRKYTFFYNNENSNVITKDACQKKRLTSKWVINILIGGKIKPECFPLGNSRAI